MNPHPNMLSHNKPRNMVSFDNLAIVPGLRHVNAGAILSFC